MSEMKSIMARVIVQFALIILALVLAGTLTAVGLVWLMHGLTAFLAQHLSEHWSAILVGLLCLSPFLILFALLFRLRHNTRDLSTGEQRGSLRQLVRENPWETISAAFIFGLTYRNDPQMSRMLLNESLAALSNPQKSEKDDNE